MLHDSGLLTFCRLKNTAPNGAMPREQLVSVSEQYYGERTIGFGRQYAAKGVSEQVDLLAEVWQDRSIRIGMYAVDDLGDQYRIDNVQHTTDDDGILITILTLRRLDDLYDLSEEAEDVQ